MGFIFDSCRNVYDCIVCLVVCTLVGKGFLLHDMYLVVITIPFQGNKVSSKRLTCSVATQPVPFQTEESKMDTPKEILLKDYKMPDYYFDTVNTVPELIVNVVITLLLQFCSKEPVILTLIYFHSFN